MQVTKRAGLNAETHHIPGGSVWAGGPLSLQPVAEVRPAAPPPPGCLGSRFQMGDWGC